jgi:hypothetical protein
MLAVIRLTPLTSLLGVGAAYLSPTLMLIAPSTGLWGQMGYDEDSGTLVDLSKRNNIYVCIKGVFYGIFQQFWRIRSIQVLKILI